MTTNDVSRAVSDIILDYLEKHGMDEDARDEVYNAVINGIEDAFSDADMQLQMDEDA